MSIASYNDSRQDHVLSSLKKNYLIYQLPNEEFPQRRRAAK